MRNKYSQKGFTLIELLLYMGIASSVLLASTFFLQTLLESRVKNQTVAEVEQQGLQVMQIITQTIRNAENVISPAAGADGPSLTLDVSTASNNPTVFDASNDIITITEGAGSPIALTNSRVAVSSLSFQNLSRVDTPGVVRISFTLTYINYSGRQEYDFEKTFYATASLRQPQYE